MTDTAPPPPPQAPGALAGEEKTSAGPRALRAAGTAIGWAVGVVEPLKRFAIDISIVLAIFFGGPAIYRLATKSTFVIKDISVPASLGDRGFSGNVIAQQLLDHIAEIDAAAGSKKEKADISGFDLSTTMPSIDLPIGGFNLTSVVSEVRQLLGYSETKISGEVYVATPASAGTPAQYGLRLRISGHGPLFRTEVPTDNIDQMLETAAQSIMRHFDPINLGYYFYKQKDFHRAYEITEEALADSSPDNDPWAYTMRGLIARDNGNIEDAAANFREAISHSSKFWLGYVNLSGVLRRQGHLDEAEAAARKAIELAPDKQDGHSALALVYAERDDVESALREMKAGVEADPKDPGGHLQLGKLLARQQRFDEALTALATSAALGSSAEPLLQAADVAKTLKRGEAQMDYLRQATVAEPKHVAAWLSLGEAELQRLNLRRAMDAFTKAVDLDVTPASIGQIGKALAAAHHFSEADALMAKAGRKFAGKPDFLLACAELLAAQGKKTEADARLLETLAVATDAQTFEEAGRLLETEGDPADAIRAYQKATAYDPQRQDAMKAQIDRLSARLTPAPHPLDPIAAATK